MTPRVSVVMPVYGDLRFIDAAVTSVLAQTFQDFEFIIVDDGNSCDALFARLSARDPRIRLVTNAANQGIAAAINRGIGVARGEFIARLDADDVAMPDLLARQVAALGADAALGIVGAGFVAIGEDDTPGQTHRRPQTDFAIRWVSLFGNPFCHPASAFRRACYDAAGGYDDAWRVSGDYEFWLRLLRRCRGANIQEPLLLYRENPRGLTATHADTWHDRNDPLRQRGWESLGIAYHSRLADQLARFAFGEEISDHALRAPAYRAGLALLRRLAAAPRPHARGGDQAEIKRVVRSTLQRMRKDRLVDLRAAVDPEDLAWAESLTRRRKAVATGLS